jgi:hypothetical protein
MNFKYFKEEFINKWNDNNALSQRDRKVQAGVNWLYTIHKQSFNRYETMWNALKDKCASCAKQNCEKEYIDLLQHAKVKSEDKNNLVITNFKENEKFENYKKCKKNCYEKVELLDNILARKYREWNKELNHCFILCRAKPIDKNNDLPNCYITCMINKSYELADIEFYIKYVYDKLIQEYDKNYIDKSKADLTHIYRIQERPLTDDIIRKYF